MLCAIISTELSKSITKSRFSKITLNLLLRTSNFDSPNANKMLLNCKNFFPFILVSFRTFFVRGLPKIFLVELTYASIEPAVIQYQSFLPSISTFKNELELWQIHCQHMEKLPKNVSETLKLFTPIIKVFLRDLFLQNFFTEFVSKRLYLIENFGFDPCYNRNSGT